MVKKRTFNVGVNDVTDKLTVTIKDVFEIDPASLDNFKYEYFHLIDKYNNDVL